MYENEVTVWVVHNNETTTTTTTTEGGGRKEVRDEKINNNEITTTTPYQSFNIIKEQQCCIHEMHSSDRSRQKSFLVWLSYIRKDRDETRTVVPTCHLDSMA